MTTQAAHVGSAAGAGSLRLPPPAHAAHADATLLRAQESFAQTISRAQERPGSQTAAQQARASAEQLVSIALVEPALRMMRESSMAAPPFAPSGVEQRFGAMLDAQRAGEIVRSANMPIVERMARDLLGRSSAIAPTTPTTPTTAASPTAAAAPIATPNSAPGFSGPGALDELTMRFPR